jgi:hypothetical protein
MATGASCYLLYGRTVLRMLLVLSINCVWISFEPLGRFSWKSCKFLFYKLSIILIKSLLSECEGSMLMIPKLANSGLVQSTSHPTSVRPILTLSSSLSSSSYIKDYPTKIVYAFHVFPSKLHVCSITTLISLPLQHQGASINHTICYCIRPWKCQLPSSLLRS